MLYSRNLMKQVWSYANENRDRRFSINLLAVIFILSYEDTEEDGWITEWAGARLGMTEKVQIESPDDLSKLLVRLKGYVDSVLLNSNHDFPASPAKDKLLSLHVPKPTV